MRFATLRRRSLAQMLLSSRSAGVSFTRPPSPPTPSSPRTSPSSC